MNNSKRIIYFISVVVCSFLCYVVLFSFVALSGLNPKVLQSEDTLATATIPFSLLAEGNFDVNEYYSVLTLAYPHPDDPNLTPYYLKKVNDHYYSFFPTFTAVIATPLYIIPTLLNIPVTIDLIRVMGRISGAFIVALSCGVFWLILEKNVKDRKLQLLLLIIYAFGTNSLSTNSQGLWQHGTSQLFLSLGLYLFLIRKYGLAGFSFACAAIARPTNLLSLVVFGAVTLFTEKKARSIAPYIGLALIPLIYESVLETSLFGSILNSGYATHTSHFTSNPIEGFLGMWLSPSKGILITSPVFLFLGYTVWNVFKKKEYTSLNAILLGIIFVHTFVMGMWYDWFGGFSWGYRMASDMIPFIVFLLIPFVTSVYFKHAVWRRIFYLLTGISILIHLSGLIFFDGIWHTIYDRKSRWWLWSIQNSELVFSVKRVLFKIGISKVNPIPIEYIAP